MSAPSQNPDQPVTAGSQYGAGPGPESLGLPAEQSQDVSNLAAYLPVFEWQANTPGATASFKNFVRRLKGAL